MILLWMIFFTAAAVIVIAGIKLSGNGDIIAHKTGLGRMFVGSILIAGATSLPELVTIGSAAFIGAADIAVGNVFGSCLFNLVILAFVDLIQGPGPLMLYLNLKHILSALSGMLLLGIAALFILLNYLGVFSIAPGGIGLGSLIIFLLYIISARLNYRYDDNKEEKKQEELFEVDITLSKAVISFTVAAVMIIIGGIILSLTADRIAALTGLEQTFMGTILMAAATSLPEVATVVGALKINAYNMAAANIFGSNIFNVLIIAIADVFFRAGSIFNFVSLDHIVTALIAIILSGIAVIGLFYRSKKSVFYLGWDSIMILIIYLFGVFVLFQIGIVI